MYKAGNGLEDFALLDMQGPDWATAETHPIYIR
jgi:hypothetical protein